MRYVDLEEDFNENEPIDSVIGNAGQIQISEALVLSKHVDVTKLIIEYIYYVDMDNSEDEVKSLQYYISGWANDYGAVASTGDDTPWIVFEKKNVPTVGDLITFADLAEDAFYSTAEDKAGNL